MKRLRWVGYFVVLPLGVVIALALAEDAAQWSFLKCVDKLFH